MRVDNVRVEQNTILNAATAITPGLMLVGSKLSPDWCHGLIGAVPDGSRTLARV